MSTRAVERRIVTVLFADLVGFTSLSERLDAEDVSIVQDAYFETVRETIGRHGGVLEKFVGDAAMAVFGAPRAADDDAERAVSAGLALVAAVERLSVEVGLGEGTLRLRVGVNSGEAVYGEATAERGPVTGDTVNVAARLQAAADPGSVVVGDVTALAVGELAELEPLAPLELKGKAEPVRAFRVAGLYPVRSRERALGDLHAPLIGRGAELDRLLAGLGSSPSPVLVVAPPGVGKSRLLAELATAAETRGAAVLRAQLRPDVLFPFEAVAQLVRESGFDGSADQLRQTGLSEARSEVVAEALSAVLSPTATEAAAEDREQLFAAWLDGLDALASDAPLLWLVEDVHWASTDFLAFLSRSVERGRDRLVVATGRPSLLELAPDWCETADLLHLPPLPHTDVAALVQALVGPVLPTELVHAVAARSGGNALFVEELLRAWIGTGVLVRDGGSWRLTVVPEEVGLPPTVQVIYAAQLDDLAPPARNAARRASVAGRRFPLDALRPSASPIRGRPSTGSRAAPSSGSRARMRRSGRRCASATRSSATRPTQASRAPTALRSTTSSPTGWRLVRRTSRPRSPKRSRVTSQPRSTMRRRSRLRSADARATRYGARRPPGSSARAWWPAAWRPGRAPGRSRSAHWSSRPRTSSSPARDGSSNSHRPRSTAPERSRPRRTHERHWSSTARSGTATGCRRQLSSSVGFCTPRPDLPRRSAWPTSCSPRLVQNATRRRPGSSSCTRTPCSGGETRTSLPRTIVGSRSRSRGSSATRSSS